MNPSEKGRMLITSMNSSASVLEKCHCQQREMITQSDVPWEVIERDCILMPPRRGNKVYLSRLLHSAACLSLPVTRF